MDIPAAGPKLPLIVWEPAGFRAATAYTARTPVEENILLFFVQQMMSNGRQGDSFRPWICRGQRRALVTLAVPRANIDIVLILPNEHHRPSNRSEGVIGGARSTLGDL